MNKLLLAVLLVAGLMQAGNPPKRVLFFSKASSWEQKIVHRDGSELSYIEKAVQKLGRDNRIEFTFSKDGTVFTPENAARFDAFFFFTSGDLTHEDRNGRGDNYPLMTLEGKKAFMDAVRNGKGFVGCNTANYTFVESVSPGEKNDPANAWRYTKMIGSGYMGHNEIQNGHFSYLDRKFPGMEKVPADYAPVDQWYAFNRLMPDLHVIMALDSGKLTGNLYERPDYPIAWARMEGKGRVFYTTMGHTAEIWKDATFLRMLLGGIRWATRMVDADVTPDIGKITPRANEIPQGASKFIASNPPADNPHFPNFKVWLDREYRTEARTRVLFFTKSAGYEHPIVYRDTAWPSPLEKEMLDFGQENHIDFIFSKDGTIFTPENIAEVDAFLLYTSGDLTYQPRNGLGDNYKLMTPEGKQAFLQAIREGKGFIGVHSDMDAILGAKYAAKYAGHDRVQRGRVTPVDRHFPGMEHVPTGFTSSEEWYSFRDFQPDLHILLYHRPNDPVAWTRMEGKGRVYYTSLGHGEGIWKDAVFRQMILGAIRWTTGMADAGMK